LQVNLNLRQGAKQLALPIANQEELRIELLTPPSIDDHMSDVDQKMEDENRTKYGKYKYLKPKPPPSPLARPKGPLAGHC